MMTFPRYDSYKDSGVEWLGEIPSHWDCRRLKHIAKVRLSNVDKHSRANELPVKLCNYTDVYYQSFITNEVNFMEATATEEQIYNFSLEKGDVLITKDSESFDDIAVSAYVPKTLKNVICGYHLAHIKPTHIEGSYLFRAFQAEGISSQFRVSANGITRFGIGKSAINDAVFLLPPIAEQKRIVEFLDRSTAEIDRAIAQKQRLIELLQEQKAILINQAVTKGLNPNVPMRDSAIDWIGEIPEHWDFRRAKFLFSQSRLPVRKIDDVVTCYRDGEVTLRTNRRTEGYTFAILEQGYQGVRSGQLVINSMDAFAGAIGVSDSDGKCSPEYVVCDPVSSDLVEPKYYALLLREMALKGYIEVICPAVRQRGLRIRYNSFAQLLLPLPSKDEQRKIIEKVDAIISGTAEALDSLYREIDLLKEMKSIVISQAVTGKIKV